MGRLRQTLIACGRRWGAALAGAALALLVYLPTTWADEPDPGGKWLTLYGWIQTGDRLAAGEQWALATGSYVEARRLIENLAAEHPGFEPELVAYRTGKLGETIADCEARLADDEHDTMMKYLDFIESFELGQAQRYANEFEAAYATLNLARAVLDEIIADKPESFREAVASQYDRLVDGIDWLDSQINFKEVSRSRPATFVGDSIDWGTTRYVKASDLPKSDDGTLPTGILFPGALSAPSSSAVSAPSGAAAEATDDDSGTPALAPVRFRLNSKEKPDEDEVGEGVPVTAPLP